jgi:hypothetical protein
MMSTVISGHSCALGSFCRASVSRRVACATPSGELLRLRVGQRLQQRRVYDAKNRSCRSNAEGNRQNGDRGEAGRFPKHAQTEAKVLEENVDKIAGDRITAFLFESRFSSELDPRPAVCFGAP